MSLIIDLLINYKFTDPFNITIVYHCGYKIADMIRNLLLTFGLILSTSIMLFAQQGALKGKVIDKKTKGPCLLERQGPRVKAKSLN